MKTFTVGNEAFELQHLSSESPELTDELIRQFTDTFRFIFCNPPYGQYLFYPSEGKAISPQKVFATEERYISLETLDHFDLESFPRHPQTGEQALFWHDPETSFRRFQKKLRERAYLTLLRKPRSEDILGACLGYETTLQRAFEQEEWKNPFHYSQLEDPKRFRDKTNFIERIRTKIACEISPTTEVFCYNCIFVDPALQEKGIGFLMQKEFLEQLPSELLELLVISEMIAGTKIFELAIKYFNATPVPGILTSQDPPRSGDGVIIIAKLNHYLRGLN